METVTKDLNEAIIDLQKKQQEAKVAHEKYLRALEAYANQVLVQGE
jgi:hypothetical protein